MNNLEQSLKEESKSQEVVEIENFSMAHTAGFRNLIAVKDYSTDTRKLFRELQEEVLNYKKMVQQQNMQINQMQQDINTLKARFYSTGPTS